MFGKFSVDFFGNEGKHRMQQPERFFQNGKQYRGYPVLFRIIAALIGKLCPFDIPVAKIIPEEFINAVPYLVIAVPFKGCPHIFNRFVKGMVNPSVKLG